MDIFWTRPNKCEVDVGDTGYWTEEENCTIIDLDFILILEHD